MVAVVAVVDIEVEIVIEKAEVEAREDSSLRTAASGRRGRNDLKRQTRYVTIVRLEEQTY